MRRLLYAVILAAIFFPASSQAASESLRVLPLRSRPVIESGQTLASTLEVKNSGSEPLLIRLSAEKFAVTNEQYDYRFEEGSESDWVRFPVSEFVLQPEEQRDVAYSIAVPGNASPGGYYFSLFAAGEPTAQSDAIREVKRVASLVYLEIPGDLRRDGKIVDANLVRLTFDRNLSYELRLINQGNVHYEVDSRLKLTSILNNQLSDFQLTGLLLPGTIRKLQTDIMLPVLPGIYKVDGTVSFPAEKQNVPTRYVLYVPPWAILLGVIVIGFLSYRHYAKRHNHKRKR
jgi:hypothetical protein